MEPKELRADLNIPDKLCGRTPLGEVTLDSEPKPELGLSPVATMTPKLSPELIKLGPKLHLNPTLNPRQPSSATSLW